MLSCESAGDSANSPAQAICDAIGHAVAPWHGVAARKHVFIHSLCKRGQGWHATLDVILEPNSDFEEIEHQEQQRALERKKQELARQQAVELQHAHHEQYELHNEQSYNMYTKRRLDKENDEIEYLTFFIELSYQEIFMEAERDFNFAPNVEYSVHYMPEGSLLEASKKYAPDIEMSEAAHDVKHDKGSAPLFSFTPPKRETRLDDKPELNNDE